MKSSRIERNAQILLQLLRALVTERYKRMAREEVLSRFMSGRLDPVLLIDLQMRAERDAVELTEVSLLELVTSDRMNAETKRSAIRIQQAYQEIYGEEIVPNFLSDHLVDLRIRSLRSRIDFYNSFLSVPDELSNSLELAAKGFEKAERFEKKLSAVLDADQRYAEELVRQTDSIHRFMMRKQLDHELAKAKASWEEFLREAFKKPQALP